MNSINILMLADSFMGGGKQRRIIELIKGLRDLGHNLMLVVLKPVNQYPEVNNLGIEVIWLKKIIKKDPLVFFQLYKICTRFKPHIIHTWGSMASIYILPIAKIKRIKFVNAMIANAKCKTFSTFWWRAKITFPFSDVILANSFAGIKAYKAPAKKSKVIYNGFHFSRIDNLTPKEIICKKLGITTKYIVGMVGMVDKRKDHQTFIEAARSVINQCNEVSFVLVGDGLCFDYFMNYTRNDNEIIFTGWQKDIESIINAFDIGILTTNQNIHQEGISNAILEYMALGKPVIATEGGGTNEIVVNNETGYLISHGDIDDLSRKILSLLENNELRKNMGKKGRARIKNHFGIEKMIHSVQDMYTELLT